MPETSEPGISEPVRLACGPLDLQLQPELGGAVAAFRHRGRDIFRPLAPGGRVVDSAMFPMAPYANRIAGNAVAFRGRTHRVAANNPPEIYNVHGTAWIRSWRLAGRTRTTARLTLDLEEESSPWSYHAEQEFRLDPGGLTVALVLRNDGAAAMPFGLGLHPWFLRDADATLAFVAERIHPEGPDMVALPAAPLTADTDFAAGGPLPDRWFNNDFGGWTGRAELGFPARGLAVTLRADAVFGHLMLYADPAQPFFCVEPQSNAAGALGRDPEGRDPREGVRVLDPGQAMGGEIRFDIKPLSRQQP